MEVAYLGWGSLIWDHSRPFAIVGDWQTDGPLLPLEFARQSSDGRNALVIVDGVPPVQSLWAWLEAKSIPAAIEDLRNREGTTAQNIGRWPSQEALGYAHSGAIGAWATERGIPAVVWTALQCGMKSSRGVLPTLNELQSHLSKLASVSRAKAAEYVSKAPAQIQTPYRQPLSSAF